MQRQVSSTLNAAGNETQSAWRAAATARQEVQEALLLGLELWSRDEKQARLPDVVAAAKEIRQDRTLSSEQQRWGERLQDTAQRMLNALELTPISPLP